MTEPEGARDLDQRALELEDLKGMNLPDELREKIRHARIEADTVRKKIAPHDIISWRDFLIRLREAYIVALENGAMFGGINPKDYLIK